MPFKIGVYSLFTVLIAHYSLMKICAAVVMCFVTIFVWLRYKNTAKTRRTFISISRHALRFVGLLIDDPYRVRNGVYSLFTVLIAHYFLMKTCAAVVNLCLM